MGENYQFEKEIDKELNFPMTEFVSAIGNVFIRKMLRTSLNLSKFDLNEPIKPFLKSHPNHFLPYAIMGYIYHTERNEKESNDCFKYAYQLAEEFPEINKPFISLLPSKNQFFQPKREVSINEFVPNKIWNINGMFIKSKDDLNPIDLQSTIVKLEGTNEIIIINPLPFEYQENSEFIIDEINSIGTVVAIISSTGPHSVGIINSRKIWPNAKLFGTERHGHVNTRWSGYLNDNNQLFEPDLYHYTLKGQNWGETVFYHPSSKTLLGLTDLGISPLHDYKSWSMVVYCIALGMWKGSKTSSIAFQNYQRVFITDLEEFRSSWAHILMLDFDKAILGHGGILQGENVKASLHDSLSWLIDSPVGLSLFEKFYIPPYYAIRVGIPSTTLKALWANFFKK